MSFNSKHSKYKILPHRRESQKHRIQSPYDISIALTKMDKQYHAIFSTWVKNEKNLPAAISHLCQVSQDYSLPQIIICLKWLITDWKLKSILFLVNHLTKDWQNEEHLGQLTKELGERWKPPYIAELANAVMDRWNLNKVKLENDLQTIENTRILYKAKKEQFLKVLMRGWQFNQIADLFMCLGKKVEWDIKSSIFKWHHQSEPLGNRNISLFKKTPYMKMKTTPFDSRRKSGKQVTSPIEIDSSIEGFSTTGFYLDSIQEEERQQP